MDEARNYGRDGLPADLAACTYHLDMFCCLILPGPLLCAHFICLRANIRRSWDGDRWTRYLSWVSGGFLL
ncbi:unnamed protein product [Urochloa humidicola]